jgi:hypothetical protein
MRFADRLIPRPMGAFRAVCARLPRRAFFACRFGRDRGYITLLSPLLPCGGRSRRMQDEPLCRAALPRRFRDHLFTRTEIGGVAPGLNVDAANAKLMLLDNPVETLVSEAKIMIMMRRSPTGGTRS